MKKLINVTFKDNEKGVNILASSFHKMYEVYTLECCLSKDDSNELMNELKEAKVRILSDWNFFKEGKYKQIMKRLWAFLVMMVLITSPTVTSIPRNHFS